MDSTVSKKEVMLRGVLSFIFVTSLMTTVVLASGSHGERGKGHMMEKMGHNPGMESLNVPEKYKGKKNPYWVDIDAIIAGSKIYNEKCALCHGDKGKGDGPLAASLNPKPFPFEDSKHMASMNDDYLSWRVIEGGGLQPFNSAMPSFKNILTEDEVWKVLSYAHIFSHIKLLIHKPGEEIPGVEEKHTEGKMGH